MNTKLLQLVFLGILISGCSSFVEPDKTALRNDALQYAWLYSGTVSQREWNDNYWDTIGKYLDRSGFNMAMELNSTPSKKYIDTIDNWNWISDTFQSIYKQKRYSAK